MSRYGGQGEGPRRQGNKQLTEKFARMMRCRVSDNCVPGFVSGAEWGWGDAGNYVAELVRKYPESCIPDKALRFRKDGDRRRTVMAYFSNGSDGEYFERQCEDCPFGDKGCPVLRAHLMYNYDQIGNKGLRAALNMLVDEHGDCQVKKFLVPELTR